MPIRPPNLDDRRFDDILEEAKALIPQYCPEWTNFGPADPGMTLVQLFAWMTEMTLYRLNPVPDRTYVHFLNFIGEERRNGLPSHVAATFSSRSGAAVELPAFTQVATKQREGAPSQEFILSEGLTVHDSSIIRVMAVRGGLNTAVRELIFSNVNYNTSAITFGQGRGVPLFDLNSEEYGPQAYTSHQYLYVGHEDFRIMGVNSGEDDARPGRLRIRRPALGQDELSLVNFFDWEYPTKEGWQPVIMDVEPEEILGMTEEIILTELPGIVEISEFGEDTTAFNIPEGLEKEKYWIRGRVDYERWLAARMDEDLEVGWKDDRGGRLRKLHNWQVRSAGRALEFFLQDLPPVKAGWTVRFAMVDRGLPAGHNTYLPKYRWSYRRGETWEEIPTERARTEGTLVTLTGPFVEMATDGFNLRAERLETVFLRGLAPDLELEVNWIRPVKISIFAGEDAKRSVELPIDEGPWSPFQVVPQMSPSLGRKWYIGSDLFENRRQSPVLVEVEVDFEMNGESILEPDKKYQLQLSYRADDNWRVVYSKDKMFAGFTFSSLDSDGAKQAGRRKVRFVLDPAKQLKGLARHTIGGVESTWLRLELTKANLSAKDEDKNVVPIIPKIYGIKLGADKSIGNGTYDQPLPNPSIAEINHRQENKRLTRCVSRSAGRLSEDYPFYPFIDIEDEGVALYLEFDKPLPAGARHAIQFKCRGESFLPDGIHVDWEVLEAGKKRRSTWKRIVSGLESDDVENIYQLQGSGTLRFQLPVAPEVGEHGFWMRAVFHLPEGLDASDLPGLPPLTHVMLNTIGAINLVRIEHERYSGLGVPNQVITLSKNPIFIHAPDAEKQIFPRADLFEDIRLTVEGADGEREQWSVSRDGNLLTAGKDDAVFVVDPVDGTISFGNGIRGRMAPVGTHNIIVERYHQIPGSVGNIGPNSLSVVQGLGDAVQVTNLIPAVGGRDAESVDEIIRRAPSILTSRDRAVTRQDFEIIAGEASAEVARAYCEGTMGADGTVSVTVLPHRREGESTPDPYLASGLKDHVQSYLSKRCLVNVQPEVSLAKFMEIDVSIDLKLRKNANHLQVREDAAEWVRNFVDPYVGGLDSDGWPFGGTLFAQDFARMVSELGGVRHVVSVQLFDMSEGDSKRRSPGWEEGEGLAELGLSGLDLFVVRRVRVLTEEAGS